MVSDIIITPRLFLAHMRRWNLDPATRRPRPPAERMICGVLLSQLIRPGTPSEIIPYPAEFKHALSMADAVVEIVQNSEIDWYLITDNDACKEDFAPIPWWGHDGASFPMDCTPIRDVFLQLRVNPLGNDILTLKNIIPWREALWVIACCTWLNRSASDLFLIGRGGISITLSHEGVFEIQTRTVRELHPIERVVRRCNISTDKQSVPPSD
jgi:hypothetical protein